MIVRETNDGTQGLAVYPANGALMKWLTTNEAAPDFKGATILDLGCGCGALGFGMLQAGASKVISCDAEEDVLENMMFNATANELQVRTEKH